MDDPETAGVTAPEDLLAAVAGHADRQAFAALFTLYAPRLTSYLRRLGANDAQAQELVQEVMLTVWRRAASFDRSRAGASTWIFTIARNKRIDAIRRERRPEPEDPCLEPEAEPLPDAALARNQQAEQIQAALKDLPEDQVQVLRLSFFEDMSHGEIATHLDLPLGTVKSRIRLALKRLRGTLEAYS